MSSERDMRRRVIRALRPLNAISVENGVGIGTPDINFVDGWIELKSVEKWPADPDKPLAIRHFTQQQRVWLVKRCRAGGVALLLLKCGNDWLLFDGRVAAMAIGYCPRTQLLFHSVDSWEGGLDEEGLVECLKSICRHARNST